MYWLYYRDGIGKTAVYGRLYRCQPNANFLWLPTELRNGVDGLHLESLKIGTIFIFNSSGFNYLIII